MQIPPRFQNGAVDLSALAARPAQTARQAPAAAPGGPGAPAGASVAGGVAPAAEATAAGGGFVVDVTTQTFQQLVLQLSMQVPVIVDFWADWCQPCRQLSPLLETAVNALGGRMVLAKVDIEANRELAGAAQVQSIPYVIAVIGGQALPLFTGAVPASQVRDTLAKVLQAAAQAGVDGSITPADLGLGEVAEPEVDERETAAMDALDRGDFTTARANVRAILNERPADPTATLLLGQVDLLERVSRIDQSQLRAYTLAGPADVTAALTLADVEFVSGRAGEAIARLIASVRVAAGDDRAVLRERLVSYFDLLGPQDPLVVRGRQQLAMALF